VCVRACGCVYVRVRVCVCHTFRLLKQLTDLRKTRYERYGP
jgi:hypothetical protein